MTQKNINTGPISSELDKHIARFAIAEDVIGRIDNLLAVAPELFETDKYHDLGKVYSGDIEIAIRSIVGGDETTELYVVEDNGIAFTAERKRQGAEDVVSAVFIAAGRWTEKFEELENRVRNTH